MKKLLPVLLSTTCVTVGLTIATGASALDAALGNTDMSLDDSFGMVGVGYKF